jgi:hypothetical protein
VQGFLQLLEALELGGAEVGGERRRAGGAGAGVLHDLQQAPARQRSEADRDEVLGDALNAMAGADRVADHRVAARPLGGGANRPGLLRHDVGEAPAPLGMKRPGIFGPGRNSGGCDFYIAAARRRQARISKIEQNFAARL